MRISDARVIVCGPARNFVTLKLTTDDGVTGVGDATLNGRELAVASYLRDHVCPLLIGRDAHAIEDTWQYLYKGAYWRRGPVTMTAIAAVDTALWDIKGKVAGLPVYELLGGRSRAGVMVYGHASGSDVASLNEDVARFLEDGYRAVRVQSAVPGLDATYGIRGDAVVYEPADGLAALRAGVVDRGVSRLRAADDGGGPRRPRLRLPPAARRPSPAVADRGRPARARGSSRTGCSGWRTRRRPSTRRASG